MNFQPIHARIVIERDKPEEKTAGGLYIPEAAKTPQLFGKVLAIGPEVKELKVGDRVCWNEYDGQDLELPEGNFWYLREDNIIGVVE